MNNPKSVLGSNGEIKYKVNTADEIIAEKAQNAIDNGFTVKQADGMIAKKAQTAPTTKDLVHEAANSGINEHSKHGLENASVIERLKAFYHTKVDALKETDFYKNLDKAWTAGTGVVVNNLTTVGNKIGKWIDIGASKLGIENLGLAALLGDSTCTWLAPVLGGVALGSAGFIAYKGIKYAVLKYKSFKQARESEKRV